MPSKTDFNVSPYYDDFSEAKKFHRVMYRPAFAVQARELTTQQTILQNQIEKLGDSIYKHGSMVIPGEAIYGVSKHAALALSESLWQGLRNTKSNIGSSVLCPGFVNTNIIESNRNRPDHLSSENKTNFILKKLASTVLKRGKEPDDIADVTLDAIKNNHFYILPHTSYDEMIKERYSRILARTEPKTADMQEILKGTLMGDKGEW